MASNDETIAEIGLRAAVYQHFWMRPRDFVEADQQGNDENSPSPSSLSALCSSEDPVRPEPIERAQASPQQDVPTPAGQEQPINARSSARERELIRNQTAQTMLYALSHSGGNDSSDYSFAGNLNPAVAQDHPDNFTYPDRLPTGLCFVDFTGWLPANECLRFLWMGYRVWDQGGRRMYLAGHAWGYDSLKHPFRYAAKTINSQGPQEYPDLYTQMAVDESKISTEERLYAVPVSNVIRALRAGITESSSPLTQAKNAWTISRAQASLPCYTIVDIEDITATGGVLLDENPLKPLSSTMEPPIMQDEDLIGIDARYLRVQYPSLRIVDYREQAPADLCSKCTALDFEEIFHWGLVDFEINLGTVKEISQRSTCAFCNIVSVLCADGVGYMQRYQSPQPEVADRNDTVAEEEDMLQVRLIRNPIRCRSTKPHLLVGNTSSAEYLGPIVSLATVRGDFVGHLSLLSEEFVDYDFLKNTLTECDLHHQGGCAAYQDIDTSRQNRLPSLLLNVDNMSLEQVKETDTRYVALSYVWGQGPMLQTRKQNLADHQEPRGLEAAELSRVVKDSISVVRGLGLRYLWVDALCIVQDDFVNKQEEIERMADIYSLAYVTIISLSGQCADDALSGVSIPRPQATGMVKDMALTAHLSPLERNAFNRTYETRAWTLQERLTSRRCLYFEERQVYFECDSHSTSDHEQLFPSYDRKGMHGFNTLHLRGAFAAVDENAREATEIQPCLYTIDSLCMWSQLVSRYTSRSLTHSSDIENAFLGIQNVLRQRLGWRLLGGLPTGIWDWALLWVPNGQLERRVWESNHDDSTNCLQPPSWSWLGWSGQVSFSCYTYLDEPFFRNLRPRVESYKLRTKHGNLVPNREPAEIWHASVLHNLSQPQSGPESPMDPQYNQIFHENAGSIHSEIAILSILLDACTVLEFEAETTAAFIELDAIAEDFNAEKHAQNYAKAKKSKDMLKTVRQAMDALDAPSRSTISTGESRGERYENRVTTSTAITTDLNTTFLNARKESSMYHLDPHDLSDDEGRIRDPLESKSHHKFPLKIEWLNTGPAYGMLRHGLRHRYNDTIYRIARAQDPQHLTLVAMSDCDIQFTVRGGDFGEDKAFPQKDQIIMMLVLWDKDFEVGERIAIGYAASHVWDGLPADQIERRLIRLR